MTNPLNTHQATLDVKPLSTRSVILSVLLGSHPPSLPAKELSSLAVLFGFKHGTIRTALSRMISNSELLLNNGVYSLGPRLLERQRAQDSGRKAVETGWDGTWTTVVVLAERRTVAERRTFRSKMEASLMGELRPDLWLRPTNVLAPACESDLMITTGPLKGPEPDELARRLWPLRVYSDQTMKLLRTMATTRGGLEDGDHNVIPETFHLSSEIVRFLRIEPRLPDVLDKNAAAVRELRVRYNEYERLFQTVLADFFRSSS